METINWTTIILTLGTASLTAVATLLAGLIAQRGQRKVKELEIKGQNELKAKELLFENYQRRIDRYNEIGQRAFEENRVQIEKLAQANPNISEQEVVRIFEEIFDGIQGPFQDWIEEIETELKYLQATETNKNHLEFIKKFLNSETKKQIPQNLKTFYGDFQKATVLIYALNEEMLHRKCEALFGSYLPNKELVAIVKTG